jgi:hypothetical protein
MTLAASWSSEVEKVFGTSRAFKGRDRRCSLSLIVSMILNKLHVNKVPSNATSTMATTL